MCTFPSLDIIELTQGFPSPAVPLSALVSLAGYFPQCWGFGCTVKMTSVSSVNVPPALLCLSKLVEGHTGQ